MAGHIFILTGAGISAESGLGTFRDKDGLWTKYDLSEVASIEGYLRNPKLVLDFYNARRKNLLEARHNPAHEALARLQAARRVTLVTQNVDDLHEQGGSRDVLHMHGELKKQRCGACGAVSVIEADMSVHDACAACGVVGRMRPDIVWFGEIPMHMDVIYERLATADLFVSIGTSGSVYPAAGFVSAAREMGVATMEINLEPSENAWAFGRTRYGPASVAVPAWVDEVLGQSPA